MPRAAGREPLLRLGALLLQAPVVATQALLEALRQLPDAVGARRLVGAIAQARRRRRQLLVDAGQRAHRRRQLATRGAFELRTQAQDGSQAEAEPTHGGPIGRGMGGC
jgi:hypothetical protein